MADPVVVKLGGSFLTEKGKQGSFRESEAKVAALALKSTGRDLAIVHGGGSWGHPLAEMFNLSSRSYSESGVGIAETRLGMYFLCFRMLRDVLRPAGFRPFVLYSSSLLRMDESPSPEYGRLLCDLVRTGLTPLTHGDVQLFDKGYRIVSGDRLSYLFSKALSPSRMVFVFDQPGILKNVDDPSSVIREMTVAQARDMKFEEGDATGGLGAKVASACEIASLGVETCFVSGFDTDSLIKAVKGERFSGTVIRR